MDRRRFLLTSVAGALVTPVAARAQQVGKRVGLVGLGPALLRAALGFLQLQPDLRPLHRWLDTWEGVGLITVSVERQGNGCR